jgi:hypothetical protein
VKKRGISCKKEGLVIFLLPVVTKKYRYFEVFSTGGREGIIPSLREAARNYLLRLTVP